MLCKNIEKKNPKVYSPQRITAKDNKLLKRASLLVGNMEAEKKELKVVQYKKECAKI